jgi:hypothetical protein
MKTRPAHSRHRTARPRPDLRCWLAAPTSSSPSLRACCRSAAFPAIPGQRHEGVDIGLQQLAQPAEIRRVSGMPDRAQLDHDGAGEIIDGANMMANPWELLEAWAKENVHATAFGDEATARQLAKNCLEAAKGLEFLRPQLPSCRRQSFRFFPLRTRKRRKR